MSVGTKEFMPFVPDSVHFPLHVCSAPLVPWVLATCMMEIPGHHGLTFFTSQHQLSGSSTTSSRAGVTAASVPGTNWPHPQDTGSLPPLLVSDKTPNTKDGAWELAFPGTVLSNQFTQPENMGQDLIGERQEMETSWQINSVPFTPLQIVFRTVVLYSLSREVWEAGPHFLVKASAGTCHFVIDFLRSASLPPSVKLAALGLLHLIEH